MLRWLVVSLALLVAMVHADDKLTIVITPQTSAESDTPRFEQRVAEGIVKEAGLDVNTMEVPEPRMMMMLDQGEKVLASALVRTPEREQQYYWITPMSINPITLFTLDSHPIARKPSPSFEDIDSVSVVRGGYRESVLKELKKEVMSVTSWQQAVEAVLQGRVEGVLFSQTGISVLCKVKQLDCSSLTSVMTWGETVTYLVMPRKPEYEGLATRLKAASVSYKKTPEFASLIDDVIAGLKRFGVHAVNENGALHFISSTDLLARNLWVMADQVPFFSERAPDGSVTGYAAELVRAILNEAGIEKPILSTPWDRIVKESSKSNVLAFSVARTPERENLYYWITPIASNMHALFGINGKRYTAFNMVPRDARVGVLLNDYRQQVAEDAGFVVTAYATWNDAVMGMLNGDIDYVFGSRGGITTSCRSLVVNCSNVRLVAEYKTLSQYLVLSKNGTDPMLAELLKRAANDVKNSESYQHWSASWSQKLSRANGLTHHIKDGVIKLWRENE